MSAMPFVHRLSGNRYLPAVVLIVIVSAAAALFAGSYSLAMAHPTPHRVPVGVVGRDPVVARFVTALDAQLSTRLEVHTFPDHQAALGDVERQRVFAVLERRPPGDHITLGLVPAAGASIARVIGAAAPAASAATRTTLGVTDLKPLQATDPQGLVIFYITLAAVIVGFIGAAQLSVHAAALTPPERFAAIVAYSALGGFSIAATVDWRLHALRLPFTESWAILSLTMMTCGLVFTMFHIFMGRWALLPTWVLLVLLGNPASGGAVSWLLLPQPLGSLGRWLPPGASVNAQHTAIYFHGHQYVFPYAVLACWAVVAGAVSWTWRHRRYPKQ